MRFHCVVGGSREAREAAARELLEARGRSVVHEAVAASWPFQRRVISTAADDAVRSVWVPDLHRAFPSGQTPGTRLVLTQSTYQLQRWLDWLDLRPDAIVVAHASRNALARDASEAFARRGAWGRINLVDLPGDEDDRAPDDEPRIEELRAAFQALDAGQRLETFANAAARSPGNPALQLAVASARMELQQLEPAQQALDIALALAPDWEATCFEYGKLWLRADDLERAAEQFAEAARLMPSFAAALTNLGAALAEIDRAGAAIDALQQALRYDPTGYPTLNNLAVICREQGRLEEAVEASRRVIALAPDFVFGYYNLGHALFLQGRFDEARDAYAVGYLNDPQRNIVQACRLAVARAAAGDRDRAIDELGAIAEELPLEARADVLGEAEATILALLSLPNRAADLTRVLDVVRELMKAGKRIGVDS
jgi:tetratricopeptide (TPR) repeat protein